jgi:ATP-binding cassette subfamily B protein
VLAVDVLYALRGGGQAGVISERPDEFVERATRRANRTEAEVQDD